MWSKDSFKLVSRGEEVLASTVSFPVTLLLKDVIHILAVFRGVSKATSIAQPWFVG
jgi:hypothetical protein